MDKNPIEEAQKSLNSLIGKRTRVRRRQLKITQESLASKIHVSFQQIQKYERGVSRIAACRLYTISHVLDVPLSYFFEESKGEAISSLPLSVRENVSAPYLACENHSFGKLFERLDDQTIQEAFTTLLEALSLPERNV